jgi:ribonuclease T2
VFRPVVLLAALAAPSGAFAQVAMCNMPARPALPRPDLPDARQPRRILPIGGYTLALTWSPQVCAANPRSDPLRCGGGNGQFAFTLHGLWPDGKGKDWPQYCTPTALLPRAVIHDNLCTTPSVQLLQHEWAKHGTCLTSQPELYFNLSRALFDGIRYPDMTALARRPTLTVGQFAEAFARANPAMKPNMVRVTTTRGNWLDEIWLCMDKVMEFARCPSHQGGASNTTSLKIVAGPRILQKPLPRKSAPGARPRTIRKPNLILDLDPGRVQPLANSAAGSD